MEIEKLALPVVTKLSYLKELHVPKAKVSINGLLFNSEGYGSVSKTNRSSQMTCTTNNWISHHNFPKIHEFYEKLPIKVQSLETVGKINQTK